MDGWDGEMEWMDGMERWDGEMGWRDGEMESVVGLLTVTPTGLLFAHVANRNTTSSRTTAVTARYLQSVRLYRYSTHYLSYDYPGLRLSSSTITPVYDYPGPRRTTALTIKFSRYKTAREEVDPER